MTTMLQYFSHGSVMWIVLPSCRKAISRNISPQLSGVAHQTFRTGPSTEIRNPRSVRSGGSFWSPARSRQLKWLALAKLWRWITCRFPTLRPSAETEPLTGGHACTETMPPTSCRPTVLNAPPSRSRFS